MELIESIDLNIGQAYLSEWDETQAIRELIANAIDEKLDKDILIKKISEETYEITNYDAEIEPDNFIIKEGNKSIKKGKIGKFGIGMKDAIAVLMKRNIYLEIVTSKYKFIPVYKIKCSLINDLAIFVNVYTNERPWNGTQIIIKGCTEKTIEKAKSNFLIYKRGHFKIIESTDYGQVIFENPKVRNGTIYLNGMKIAHDSKLLYSYNILHEDNILKRNITRERKDISKEIYSQSLKAIIAEVKNKEILDKYLNRFVNSREGGMSGELIYKETIIKVVSYALEIGYELVLFSVLNKEKYSVLYRDLIKDKNLKLITLNNKYYNYIKNDKELSSKNIFCEYYKANYKEIPLDKLNKEEREVYNWVEKLIEYNNVSINISTIAVTENKIVSYEPEKDKIIISRKSLRFVHSCFLEIVNAIRDSAENGERYKDYIFLQLVEKEIENLTKD